MSTLSSDTEGEYLRFPIGGLDVDGPVTITRSLYRVVAINPGGSVAGEDRRFTTQADAAPAILSASLRPKRFAVKRKRGTTFRYRLSEAATVTFTIKRRHMKAKRFRVASAAGANRHRFSGRIRRKPLKPGRYRATLVARDAAGNASRPKRLRFTVVRG
jgi:hypothetical protein